MSHEFYKILHLLGLILLFFGFGGLLVSAYSGQQLQKKARMMGFISHGLGLILIIFSGFGLAAKLGFMSQLPPWIFVKLGIWVLLGVGISVVKRKGHVGWPVAILLWGLGLTAAILGVTKSL